jgi:rhodanese-related sulfurtransferase
MAPRSTFRLIATATLLALLSGSVPAAASADAVLAQPVASAGAAQPSAQDPLAQDLWIDDAELARLMRAGLVVVVDVRDGTAYQRAHLLEAMSVPLSEVLARADELRASGKTIVTYCGGPIGEKGARAALMLRKHGLARARALSGGFAGWVARGNVVEVPPSS